MSFTAKDAAGATVTIQSATSGSNHSPYNTLADGSADPYSLTNPVPVRLVPDAVNGEVESLQATLSGTPNTVTSITLPDYAEGFEIYSTDGAIRWAISEAPQTLVNNTGTTIAESAFRIGGHAPAGFPTPRLLNPGTGRTLQIMSSVASAVVIVSVWGRP